MKIYVEEEGQNRLEEFDLPVVGIGRGKDNQLVISDPRSSRHHCRVLHTPHGFFIEDLGSRNGTLLNGAKVEKQQLAIGDVIQIGTTRFHFEGAPASSTQTGSFSLPSDSAAVTVEARSSDVEREIAAAKLAAEEEPAAPGREGAAVEAGDVYLLGLDGPYSNKRVPITKVPYTIGRKADNDFRIEDRKTSSHHARIVRRGEVFYLEDLGSRNGCFVNGRQIEQAPLFPGCRVQIGDVHFKAFVPEVEGLEPPPDQLEDSAVGSDVVAEDDFARFDVQEFLRDAESSRQQPLILLGILVVMGLIGYFTVDVTRKRLSARNLDPSPAENRLVENWSFEAPTPEQGGVPGWWLLDNEKGVLGVTTQEGVQWPGAAALSLTPGTDDVGFVRAVCQPIAVDASRPLYVSAHVLNRGSFAAGVFVSWLRDRSDGAVEVGRSYGAAVRQAGEEEDVLRKVWPPISATSAQVTCFVLQNEQGGPGAVFDRVYLGDVPPRWLEELDEPIISSDDGETDGVDEATAPPAVTVDSLTDPVPLAAAKPPSGGRDARPIETEILPDGSLSALRRGTLPLIERLAPALPETRDPLLLGPCLNEPDVYGREDGVRLMAQVPDIAGGDWVPVEINVQKAGEEIVCRYRFQRARAGGEMPDEVAVLIELPSREIEWNAFGVDGALDVSSGASATADGRELVFGRGTDQIVLRFGTPFALRVLPPAGDRRNSAIVATAAPQGNKTRDIDLVISYSSRQEDIAVAALLDSARGLRDERKLAEALDVLEGIRSAYPWRQRDLQVVARIEEEVRVEAESAADDLTVEFELLKTLPSPFIHAAIRERGEALAERFKGTRGTGDKVTETLSRIETFWEGRRDPSAEARRLLEKGRAHLEENSVHLAELHLSEVRAMKIDDPEMKLEVDKLFDLIEIRKRGERNEK